VSLLDVRRRQHWWVDPNGRRRRKRHRQTRSEALWVRSVRGFEHPGTSSDALGGEPAVDVLRREHGDAAVAVLAVVPVEEGTAVRAGVLQGPKAIGEDGPVLQRLELRLGERDCCWRRSAASGSA
jgi:hypothetical protein